MVPLVFRHFAAAFARVSPDFALLQAYFTVFPRVDTYALTQTTRKITVVCRCVCACVCVRVCGKTLKNQRNKPKNGQTWTRRQAQNVVKKSRENIQKHKKQWETCQDTDFFF